MSKCLYLRNLYFFLTFVTVIRKEKLQIKIFSSSTQNLDLDLKNQTFILLFPYVWNPSKNILMTFETFLMMSITTERYLATRNPLEYRVGQVKIVEKWNKVTTKAVSAFVFLLVLLISQNRWSGWSQWGGEGGWMVWSGLCCARIMARKIYILQ